MKILIEKEQATEIQFDPEKVYPVLEHFDNSKKIGVANVFIKDNEMYADITLAKSITGWPAVGYTIKGKELHLLTIGICQNENTDESIEPITYTV